jgi:hypothetical protein
VPRMTGNTASHHRPDPTAGGKLVSTARNADSMLESIVSCCLVEVILLEMPKGLECTKLGDVAGPENKDVFDCAPMVGLICLSTLVVEMSMFGYSFRDVSDAALEDQVGILGGF